MAKKAKRPTDTNQLAKKIVDIATDESNDKAVPEGDLKSAAALLGRKGGLKGGKARAKSLTKQERHDIAKKAAAARWHKH